MKIAGNNCKPSHPAGRAQPHRALVWAAILWLGLALAAAAELPASPVSYQHIVRRSPNFSIHVVTIDLADPRVTVRVAPGGPAATNGPAWVTTLLPPSEIAAREHFDTAINGDFFAAIATKDIEGRKTGYVRGKPAFPIGPAMTDGRLWHQAELGRPYLEITTDHHAKIMAGQPGNALETTAREVIGGGQIIVSDGQAVAFTNTFATARHPRTVVGVDRSGLRLTLFVVDGRQPELSIGMTLAELSREMVALGCDRALNLDGGGSTELVWRMPDTGRLQVLNSPSDSKERSVADVLGVTFETPPAGK
jgi:exopolysaccharide biosynthesis protein